MEYIANDRERHGKENQPITFQVFSSPDALEKKKEKPSAATHWPILREEAVARSELGGIMEFSSSLLVTNQKRKAANPSIHEA